MSGIILENRLQVSTVWIRWQPRDKNDEQTETLREIPVPTAAESTIIRQIRNRHGRLIPLSSCMGPSSEHTPLVLEATRPFQHVCPKPRTGSTTVITKRMKTRLQAANHRIQRLEELLPEIKLQQNDKRVQEMEGLKQKLKVLGQRMQCFSLEDPQHQNVLISVRASACHVTRHLPFWEPVCLVIAAELQKLEFPH
ncbi:uncharacterized protein LOC144992265 isoform X4 [Oryzias latipes]